MSATNELRTNRIIGSTDDGKKVVTAFADVEAALRTIFGIPADTAMSEAMTITNATGNVTMTGTLTASAAPTSDLHAATRGYATQVGGTSSFGNQRAVVGLTSNISLTSVWPYYIEWDAAPLDSGGFWSSGNPTRLTAPEDGEYMAGLTSYFTMPTWGVSFGASVNRSGSDVWSLGYFRYTIGSHAGMASFTPLSKLNKLTLSSGDYVEFSAYPYSASEVAPLVIYAAYTTAWIVRVA